MKLVDVDVLKLVFNSVHNFMTALSPDEPQKYSYDYIIGMFDRAPAEQCLYVRDDGGVAVLEYSYWVPCDKSHLPELYKPVFASVKSGDREWIEIVSLHKKYMSDDFYWSTTSTSDFLKTMEFDEVKAWAPLPPVYKGEK